MIHVRFGQFAVAFVVLTTALSGCSGRSGGPSLTQVSGTVTLDGNPLPNASITFQPVGEGRPSLGSTDSSGRYTLEYTEGIRGAVNGKHVVQISTWQEAYDNGTVHPAVPELVPAIYNAMAAETPEMKREVNGASATIDFKLNSKAGRIVQLAEPKSVKRR